MPDPIYDLSKYRQKIAKFIFVDPAGKGDYTTIQAALTANPTSYIAVLVAPGTYSGDTIAFTANNQAVIGVGFDPAQVIVTQTDAGIVDFGTYTDCIVANTRMTLTAPTSNHYVVTGASAGGYTGKLIDCEVLISGSTATGTYSPVCVGAASCGSAASIEIVGGVYSLDDDTSVTFKKAIEPISQLTITVTEAEIILDSTTGGYICMAVFAPGGPFTATRSIISATHTGAGSITAGVYANTASTTNLNLVGNTISGDGNSTNAYGVYAYRTGGTLTIIGAGNTYIADNGVTADFGFYIAGTPASYTSSFDTFLADNPYSSGGGATITMVSVAGAGNFQVDGDLVLSGDVTDGTDATSAAEIKDAYDHISSDGSDHTYIDQDVTSGSNPTFGVTNFTDASVSAQGVVELATAAEVDTGTDATRAVTPDSLHDSSKNVLFIVQRVIDHEIDCATGTDLIGDIVLPFDGSFVQDDDNPEWFSAYTDTAGTTGTMVVDVNLNGTTIMTTNKLDIETGEKSTTTAATQPDLTTTTFSAGDILTIDIDAVHTTEALGLTVCIAVRRGAPAK